MTTTLNDLSVSQQVYKFSVISTFTVVKPIRIRPVVNLLWIVRVQYTTPNNSIDNTWPRDKNIWSQRSKIKIESCVPLCVGLI